LPLLCSIIERLWKQDSCRVVECENCSGGFAFPFVGGNTEFYETANAGQKAGAYPADRWEYGESLSAASLKPHSSVLEVGAGDGAFVRRLIDTGVSSSIITALEYSSYGMKAIRSIDPPVNVQHGDTLGSLPVGAFTHIFLFQVMEHLGGLDEFMSNVCRLLQNDGQALISVPHPDRTAFGELSGLTLDMPPNHISRFSIDAMRALASRNALSLERVVDEPFSWRHALPEFLRYRFLRLTQKEGSISAKVHANLDGRRHKYAAAAMSLARLPHALIRLSTCKTFGSTRLFVLKKH
jgi:SAM-dependent methyltransferase